jgi:dephospho-CoA kinase
MVRIGLTGGIAAGKSVAARRFDALGAVVIDSDVLARAAVAPGTIGLARVAEAFGRQVVSDDGTLDRPALGRIVFADPAARAQLEAIIHPQVRRLSAETEAAAIAADPAAVVVHDIPLLVETGQADGFDLVVVVDAPVDLRIDRMVAARGLTREEALSRLQAQASDDDRLAAADVVLDGSGSPDHLADQVDRLWERLVADEAQASGRP